ncbi:uracil-DNA glycosylase [Allosphingosinicella indica]|uniref:DNA polymerase n=1 Tax=Allosphingosinicella indica TaxID=941907 RepID=A0A1X7FYQ1_9SPHN|nr:uracil-DNA glycosylase [Allosphingosinicella indica]SMF60626.1 DNA polymerase [Allosphingosinicella indica]
MDPATAASALEWWADAGIDVIVGEEPRNWLRAKTSEPAPPAAMPEPAAPATALPDQLGLFQDHLATSDALPHHAPGAPRVCPSGDPAAGLMIVIDMPASEDCAAGTLLSGDAGRLFDRMLSAIGRDRSSMYLAALSCFRAPSGRLSGDAARQCTDLALHHIALAKPRALLLFGDGAAHAMLGATVAQARGRWHDLETPAGAIRTLATLSPELLLRQPALKAHAWADLQMLIRELDG